jgi:hypothetical protein
MDLAEVGIGLALMVVAVLAFRVGRARNGQVRSFLRRDAVQSLYAIAILGCFAAGLVTIITGLVPG